MMTEQLHTISWNFSAVVLRKGLQQNPSDYSETGVWWGGLNSLNSFRLFSAFSYMKPSCKELMGKRLQLFRLFGGGDVGGSRSLGLPSFCGRQHSASLGGNSRRHTGSRRASNRFQYYHPCGMPRFSWALSSMDTVWTRAA